MNRESNCLDALRGRDRVRWRQEPNGLFGDIVKIGKGGRKKSLLFHTHTHMANSNVPEAMLQRLSP